VCRHANDFLPIETGCIKTKNSMEIKLNQAIIAHPFYKYIKHRVISNSSNLTFAPENISSLMLYLVGSMHNYDSKSIAAEKNKFINSYPKIDGVELYFNFHAEFIVPHYDFKNIVVRMDHDNVYYHYADMPEINSAISKADFMNTGNKGLALLNKALVSTKFTPFIDEAVALDLIKKLLPQPIAEEITECIKSLMGDRNNHYYCNDWNSKRAWRLQVRHMIETEYNTSCVCYEKPHGYPDKSWEDAVREYKGKFPCRYCD